MGRGLNLTTAHLFALVVQSDRALDFGSRDWGFESLQGHFRRMVLYLLIGLPQEGFMSISKDAALKVLEVLADRVGREHVDNKDATMSDMLIQVSSVTEKLIDATPETLPNTLVELASKCVIAVASMVAGVEETNEVVHDTRVINMDDIADSARQKMIARAKHSNIVIASIDQFD